MDYKPLLCRNPQKQGVPGKYYPAPVYEKTIGMNDFVKEISCYQVVPSYETSEFIYIPILVFDGKKYVQNY